MKRLIIFLLIVVAVGTTSIVIGVLSNKNINPVSEAQERVSAEPQDSTGVIDGRVNPELIPNRVAYSILFRLLSKPSNEY